MYELKNSNIAWIGWIPQDWKIERVKRFFYLKKQKAHQEDPTILSLARSGIKVRDISKNEGQLAESYYDYNPVEPGDLLLNPMDLYSGANCNVSKVSGVISPAYSNLKTRGYANPNYYNYYFKIQYLIMALFAHGKGVSKDNRWTLSNNTLLNYLLPVPTKEEQDQIVRYLDWKTSCINSVISTKKKQIDLLKEQEKQEISNTVLHGLRSTSFKDSDNQWIGEIPIDWEVIKLGKFCSFQNGISESGAFFTSGTPFVGYSDVYRHLELPETVNGVAQSNEQQQKVFSVREGDIFFTRTSENIDEIGMAAVCKHTIEKAVFSGFVIRCRPRVSLVDIDYMKFYLQIPAIRNHFSSMMNIVIRASLGQNLLKQMPVVIPPMDEQKEIAAYLEDKHTKYVDLIETIKKEIDTLEELKTRLVADVVTGKIDVRGIEIPEYECVEEDSVLDEAESDNEETEVSE